MFGRESRRRDRSRAAHWLPYGACGGLSAGSGARRLGGETTLTDQELLAALAAEPCLKAAVERIMGERDEWERSFGLAEQLVEQMQAHYNQRPRSIWSALRELWP